MCMGTGHATGVGMGMGRFDMISPFLILPGALNLRALLHVFCGLTAADTAQGIRIARITCGSGPSRRPRVRASTCITHA